MRRETVWRAETIFKRGEVKLIEETPNSKHFQVKQRNDKWVDVWYENGLWNCNAVTKKKNGVDSWGCVMNVKADRTKPYCSHTLAAKLLMGANK